MADREGAAENSAPDVGQTVVSWIADADLRELLRKRLQLGVPRVTLGMPRVFARGGAELLVGPRTCVWWERPAGGRVAGAFVRNEQAAALVDRVLGGPGRAGVAGRSGNLSDGEQGVLAYFVARCGAALAAFRVLDVVTTDASALGEAWLEALCWPLRVEWDELSLELVLLSHDELFVSKLSVDMLVPDTLHGKALVGLQAGDLLVSDSWPLLATTRGLEALVELHVHGLGERLAAALEGDSLRVLRVLSTSSKHATTLQLGSLALSLRQLAELAGGAPYSLAPQVIDTAILQVDEQAVARGRLVRHQGGVALRVGG